MFDAGPFREGRSLQDYSDRELMEILERNETQDLRILGGISSEVLRRAIRYGNLKLFEDENNVD